MKLVPTYNFWRKALGGEKQPLGTAEVHLGRWRFETNDHRNGGDPVALFMHEGQLVCVIGNRQVANFKNVFDSKSQDPSDWKWIEEFMTWIADKPVTQEDYDKRMDTGHWPWIHETVAETIAKEEAEGTPGIGHNNPPTSILDQLRDEIERYSVSAAKLIQTGAAKTEEESKQATSIVEELRALNKKAEKARKAEKDPHWEKCKEIDAKWNPVIDESTIYSRVLQVVVDPWLKKAEAERQRKLAEQRAEVERVRKAAEEAQRKADEEARRIADAAVQAAAQGQSVDERDDTFAVTEVAQEAERLKEQAATLERQADQTAKNTVKLGGARGKAISLHSEAVLEVTDRRAASSALKDRPGFLTDLDDLLKRYARPLIREGKAVPGITVKTEQNAA